MRGQALTREFVQIDLAELVDLFYDQTSSVGEFTEVAAGEIPAATRELLDHEQHMTVTVEKFHRCPVEVEVLRSDIQGKWYAREIVLKRSSDSAVVQYGIVRLNLDVLAESVKQEILAAEKPLGRVLIENDVLRSVRLHSLQKITAGPVLRHLFGLNSGAVCYGRTAMIYCDGQPAIHLLEVVPVSK